MDVSIIIVNYNTRNLTLQCLVSIYEKTKGISFEIIVVDNASLDNSVEYIKKEFPQVTCIENNINVGFGKANNQAVRICKGKYLFFLNSDTILIDNSIVLFFYYLENCKVKSVCCCGASLLDMQQNLTGSAGNFPSLLQEFLDIGFYIFCSKIYKRKFSIAFHVHGNEIIEVDYICGADIFIKKEIFNLVGGFDENYFMYYEETDMFYRLKNLNYKSIIIPNINIIHLESGSFLNKKTFDVNKFTMIYKGKVLYYKKNKGSLSCFFMKCFSFIFYIIRLPRYYRNIHAIISIIIHS
ncbi:N-acetylglucosaminyl-diphospho-decaprenol L-rhamnosyltransferase [termite gut metagenome]|uniref:N-acetylglucosaminyl-diphospho-decaprenol L-rhamnosyltransferase n=1 Tax=termite gut metagenome TaxID=433724 RepID=A0A5J4SUK8_9ZZZZ